MTKFPCHAFRRNKDGSWTCTAEVTISGPFGDVKLTPGTTLRRGVQQMMGLDLGALLDDKCHRPSLP